MNNSELEELKRHPSVLGIYLSRLGLKRDGKEYVGLCPLHGEKTPSFRVSQHNGVWVWKCFGNSTCGSGNIFQLLQRLDNSPFGSAVQKVKESVGQSWESTKAADKVFKRSFSEQENTAKSYSLEEYSKFEAALFSSPEAIAWIQKRGISGETAKRLHLGFRQDVGKLAGEANTEISNKGWISMPCVVGNKVVAIKYRSIVAKEFCKQGGMAKGDNTPLFNSETIEPLEPVYLTEGECFLGGTEILTPEGWIRLDEYSGQKVAQWCNGVSEYVTPLAYIKKEYKGNLVYFHTKTKSVNLKCTENHRVPYVDDRSGNTLTVPAVKVPKGNARFFRTSILNSPGIDMSDDEIRLQVAIQADASLESLAEYKFGLKSNGNDGWRAEFKKRRKIDRLVLILSRLGYTYKVYPQNGKGSTLVRFQTPPGMFYKVFPNKLYSSNLHQRNVLIDEIPHWDGHYYPSKGVKYDSVCERNVDLVQFAFSMSGKSSKKYVQTNRGGNKSDLYGIMWNQRLSRGSQELTAARGVKKEIVEYSGLVYCVTVPSSYIIVRIDGTIHVCGNCDAAILEQAGFRAVSIQSSSTPATARNKDKLLEADYVILAGDNDTTGNDYMNKLWAEMQERTFKLQWPEGLKDANQVFLEKCKGDKQAFIQLVDELTLSARSVPMPNISSLQEVMLSSGRTNLTQHPKRLRFPWPKVDEMAIIVPGGIANVMATSTKMGKTAWVMQSTVYGALANNETVLNYQCELSPEEFSTIVTAHVLRKDRNHLTADDHQRAAKLLSGVRYYIGRDPTLNRVDPVLDLIESGIRRLGATLVVLDHVHFICRNEQNEIQAQANAYQRIKNMATKYQVKFIVVGQPRKALQTTKGKVVDLSDWKGSEAGVSDSDAIFAIHRDRIKEKDANTKDDYDPRTSVHLLGCRSKGDGGTYAELMYFGKFATFNEVVNEEPPPGSGFFEGERNEKN